MLDSKTDLRSLLKDPSLLAEQSYAGGTWIDGEDGATFAVTNPARGDVIANVADLSRAQVADAIAQADATRRCAATQFFRSGFARDPQEQADSCLTDDLVQALDESDGDLRELMVTLARSTDFRHRRIP